MAGAVYNDLQAILIRATATTNRSILWCSGSMRVFPHVTAWRDSAAL